MKEIIFGARAKTFAKQKKTVTSFLPLTITGHVSACGLAPLNYAPLNYEWHGIMEIINGVRFADANEAGEKVCYSH